MENSVQPNKRTDDEVQAFYAMIVLLICVECSKEPEFLCENCGKVYKQEGRYHAHTAKCSPVGGGGVGGCISVRPSELTELLRQNREMMELIQKQQITIQTLVSQLVK
jgi:hypothetical protein